jgi:DNA helicase-2/ATP-dependent DNA helicase PcrA
LFRTNAQSEVYEEALAEAGVPYVVHGAERFFERPEVRQAMVALRAAERSTAPDTPLVEAVVAGLRALGWHPDMPPGGGAAREQWEALAALVGLAEDAARAGTATLREFGEELRRRAAIQHAPTMEGVTLASLHAAKGLEWDAVFVVGLVEGTLPTGYARTPEQIEEERRLLYVGITRARQWLWLSYAAARAPGGRPRRASRFLPGPDPAAGEPSASRSAGASRVWGSKPRYPIVVSCRVCGTALLGGSERKLGRCATCPSDLDAELLDRLHEWRRRTSAAARVPAYVVLTDATLTALAERQPGNAASLVDIGGIGPRKLALYGDAVLALVGGASVVSVLPPEASG